MSSLNKIPVVILLIISSVCAYSGPVIDGKKVTTVNAVLYEDCTYFKLEGITGTSSTKPDDPWFAIPVSSQIHDTAVSILLAAYMSDKPVRINVDEADICGGRSGINYVRFSE